MSRNGRIAALVLTGLIAAGMLAARWSVSQEKPTGEAGKKQLPAATPASGEQETAAAIESAAEQAILQKLEEPTELNFNETPISRVMERLGQKHKLEVFVNQKRLEEANVQLDTPITRSVPGLKLRQALNIVLGDLGLGFVVSGEVLEITSRERVDEHMVTQTYPVGDLARVGTRADGDENEYSRLLELVTFVIAPHSWHEAGGSGTVAVLRTVMVVTQSSERHAEIARLLARLRQARRQIAEGKGPAQFAALDCEDDVEVSAKIRAKLARKASIDWEERAIKDVVAGLARDYELPMLISQKKLEEANVQLDTPVTLKLTDVSLRAALEHMVKPLGLGWIIRDGVLLLTSKEESDTYLTARIYPIPDLLPRDDEAEGSSPLEEVITSAVRSETWKEAGGPGDIIRCDGLGCLICRQNREVHEEIEKLLVAVRKDIGGSTGPHPLGDRMVLRVYAIADPALAVVRQPAGTPAKAPPKADGAAASDVAKIVRELVAPESWQAPAGKAYMNSLGDRLIVRQTPKVHREIRALLQKLGVSDEGPTGGSGGGRGNSGFF